MFFISVCRCLSCWLSVWLSACLPCYVCLTGCVPGCLPPCSFVCWLNRVYLCQYFRSLWRGMHGWVNVHPSGYYEFHGRIQHNGSRPPSLGQTDSHGEHNQPPSGRINHQITCGKQTLTWSCSGQPVWSDAVLVNKVLPFAWLRVALQKCWVGRYDVGRTAMLMMLFQTAHSDFLYFMHWLILWILTWLQLTFGAPSALDTGAIEVSNKQS